MIKKIMVGFFLCSIGLISRASQEACADDVDCQRQQESCLSFRVNKPFEAYIHEFFRTASGQAEFQSPERSSIADKFKKIAEIDSSIFKDKIFDLALDLLSKRFNKDLAFVDAQMSQDSKNIIKFDKARKNYFENALAKEFIDGLIKEGKMVEVNVGYPTKKAGYYTSIYAPVVRPLSVVYLYLTALSKKVPINEDDFCSLIRYVQDCTDQVIIDVAEDKMLDMGFFITESRGDFYDRSLEILRELILKAKPIETIRSVKIAIKQESLLKKQQEEMEVKRSQEERLLALEEADKQKALVDHQRGLVKKVLRQMKRINDSNAELTKETYGKFCALLDYKFHNYRWFKSIEAIKENRKSLPLEEFESEISSSKDELKGDCVAINLEDVAKKEEVVKARKERRAVRVAQKREEQAKRHQISKDWGKLLFQGKDRYGCIFGNKRGFRDKKTTVVVET